MSVRLVSWQTGPVPNFLDRLLRDMTTGRNIRFMTDDYKFDPSEEMTVESVLKADIRTRVEKTEEARQSRTKARAEVFTPAWLVNRMNNECDTDWFGRSNVFNKETEKDGKPDWIGNGNSVSFAGTPGWQAYVKCLKLEITCGEAPFVVTRYDPATGERFRRRHRVGFLDRKLKIVAQSCRSMPASEKVQWVLVALKSCYGYEYQGDNLLIARANVFFTVLDYACAEIGLTVENLPMDEICDIICWNFWQMDGLENTAPGTGDRCRIMDWESGEAVFYDDCMVKPDYLSKQDATIPEAVTLSEPSGVDAGATEGVQVGDGSVAAMADGFFDADAEPEPDTGFEPAAQDRIVASSVGLLVNALPRSTLVDDMYAKGEKLCYQMACQYYGTVQGFQMILDRLGPDGTGIRVASGFGGLVDRIAVKGRITGAMKSSLRDFRNEAYEPMMKLCRDAVELVLKACLYHQQERDAGEIGAHGLDGLVAMLDLSGLPDGLGGRIRGFAAELDGYYRNGKDFRYTLDAADAMSEDENGMDLDIVVRDVGRLLGVCRKYILGIGV